jgi:uncharacterized membrane protein
LIGAPQTFGLECGSALLGGLHVAAALAWIGGSFFFIPLHAGLRKARWRRSGARDGAELMDTREF